jgi:dTMP kinase
VIADRYFDSTVAYQGGARGLGIERVEELNHWLTGGLEPDVTFLLDVELRTAAGRGGELDRFEREGEQLQRAVAEAYEELAQRHAERYVRIDAARAPADVHADVLARLQVRA